MAEPQHVDIGHIAARFLSVSLPMGLVLDEVVVEGEKLHLEYEPFRISMGTPGSLETRISSGTLASFLNEKAPGGLKEFTVALDNGLIQIQAKATMIISINVGATCRLIIEDDTKLIVELVRVDAVGGTGFQNIVQKQLDNLNPLIDAKDLPLDATFSRVEIEDGWLAIYGTVAPKPE